MSKTSKLLRLQSCFSYILSFLWECLLNIILLYKVSNIVGIHSDSKHKQYRIQYLSRLRQRRGNELNFLENTSNTADAASVLTCFAAEDKQMTQLKLANSRPPDFLTLFANCIPSFMCTFSSTTFCFVTPTHGHNIYYVDNRHWNYLKPQHEHSMPQPMGQVRCYQFPIKHQ